MCRNGGISMTWFEKGMSSAAPIYARAPISIHCWHAWVLLALLATSAQAGAPASSQHTGGDAATVSSLSAGSDATSSRSARDEAIRAIPWKSISPAGRQTAQSIINNTSIYRRLPTRIIDCDPDLFTFLL